MRVTFNWNFEFDHSDLDPKMIDIEKLAKEMAFKELTKQIKSKDITEDDMVIPKRCKYALPVLYDNHKTRWCTMCNKECENVDKYDQCIFLSILYFQSYV